MPCHMVGITPQSAITVDLRSWQSTWTSNLMFYNLSIELLPGADATVVVDNMTYMGCKAWSDKSKAVNAHFIELYTDCDLFSTFKTVGTGYLNIYGDSLEGDVTFKQSEYTHDWTGRNPDIYTRVILNGEDVDVVIGHGLTTIAMASKRINISMATQTENHLIVEMNDMQQCSLSGTGLRIGVVRVDLQNVKECTLNDGRWLTRSEIQLTNITISFESVKRVPGSLVLGDGAHVISHGTLYVEKNLEVHGDCVITSKSGGLVAARALILVAGSITTNKVRYLKMDYLCVTRRNSGTFDIVAPVVVLKAIRPGMLKVNIEELTLWSHSSGVELVFDVPSVTKDGGIDYQGAIGYQPVHVRNLKTFASNIPVNVRFEYGSVVGQLTLNAVSKTVRITMAENTHGTNMFVADVYDCGVVSVSGDNGGFFGVSLVLTDVGVCGK